MRPHWNRRHAWLARINHVQAMLVVELYRQDALHYYRHRDLDSDGWNRHMIEYDKQRIREWLQTARESR